MYPIAKVCKNPWCKARFNFYENDMIIQKNEIGDEVMIEPIVCPKCKSFNDELSGGVQWEDKSYDDGSDFIETHQVKYRVTNFKN
jgi:hypothetical protein